MISLTNNYNERSKIKFSHSVKQKKRETKNFYLEFLDVSVLYASVALGFSMVLLSKVIN